ncbi:hypothetical protein D9M72_473610 [compost metagenome]
MFEVDRQRRTAPRQTEHRLHEGRIDHIERRIRRIWHQLLLPQVASLVAIAFEDRRGRAHAHAGTAATRAARQRRCFQRIDAGRLQRQLRGNLGERVHVGIGRRQQQPGLPVQIAEFIARPADVRLLARGVQVMAPRVERRFDANQTDRGKWSHGVAHHLRAAECIHQGIDVMFRLDEFIVCRFQAHDTLRHHFLRPASVARHGRERDVLVDQPVHDQHAGVAACAIDDDGVLCHGLSP